VGILIYVKVAYGEGRDYHTFLMGTRGFWLGRVKMLKGLGMLTGIAAVLAAAASSAEARSELEKAAIKAATDCVAAAALNNPNIVKLYQQNRLKEVTDWIVLKSSACDNPLRAMRLLHDKLYGQETGRIFLLGDYLADLPRAVGDRIKNEMEKDNTSAPLSPASEKTWVTHNDSLMLMHIGNANEGVSRLEIYYEAPSEKMSKLVNRGDLFFDGSLRWETGEVVGNARVYKWRCEPLQYQVKGTLQYHMEWREWGSKELRMIDTFELEGRAPTFGDGCSFAEFAWNHNATLTFKPDTANVPVSPMKPTPAPLPPAPLGWISARFIDCANWGCFVRVSADGANVRKHPNGDAVLALVNGTPLLVSQWQGNWALVTATCNLVPTGLWSDTHRVPLTTCQKGPQLKIINVAQNDVLNVHAAPTAESRILGAIPPDADGVTYLGKQEGNWLFVRYENGPSGWVNSRYVALKLPPTNQPRVTQPPTDPVPPSRDTPEACRKFPQLCS
jgi:hypothetical protein